MRRSIVIALSLIICLGASAQRRRTVKKKVEPVALELAEEAIQRYDFSRAESLLEQRIEQLETNDQPTDREEELLDLVQKNAAKLQATERVTIIDSVVLKKENVFSVLKLSSECGSVKSYPEYFQKDENADCSVFLNQFQNRLLFSAPNGEGRKRLYQQEIIGQSWGEAFELQGLAEDADDEVNFPFMLSDGVTLYFGAENEESLGGYDIYMARYDADEKTFLAPENIGMPFNSMANDYLLVIDEFYNLGWFVTDRFQPEGYVCLYTFIPTKTRKIYNEAEIGADRLRNFALITSIQDTWANAEEVAQARARLEAMKAESQGAGKPHDFDFVLNDQFTYTCADDFKDPEAKGKVRIWQEQTSDLDRVSKELAKLRSQYADAKGNAKNPIGAQIKILEVKENLLRQEIKMQEKEIRAKEFKQ